MRWAAALSRGAMPLGSASSASSSGRCRVMTASSTARAARRVGEPRWEDMCGGLWPPGAPHASARAPWIHRRPARSDRSLGILPEALQRRPKLFLALLCLLLWLPGFFTLPATDRDEARFAQASRQMVESGDYVRIRFGEEERNKKPAGIHWLQAASVHVLEATRPRRPATRSGPTGCRACVGALLAVLATFHWGRGLVGRRAALLGAAMLASSLVLVAEAHIAKTDAALLATVTAAMGLFGLAYLQAGAFTRPAGGGVLAAARARGAAEGADRADGAAAVRHHPGGDRQERALAAGAAAAVGRAADDRRGGALVRRHRHRHRGALLRPGGGRRHAVQDRLGRGEALGAARLLPAELRHRRLPRRLDRAVRPAEPPGGTG